MNKDMLNDYPDYDEDRKCSAAGVGEYYELSTLRFSKKQAALEEKLKTICSDCKFLEKCGTYAIKYERYGFWGGMTEKERIAIRNKKGIQIVNIK